MSPRFPQGIHEIVDHRLAVAGAWRYSKAFGSASNGWVVDRLDIDVPLFQEIVARRFAEHGIAHHHRNNMADAIEDRQSAAL